MASEPLMRAVIRRTPGNHTDTPPVCDEGCKRWGTLPHAHICPDGLFEDTPFLDVTSWCSCGKRMGEPQHLDVRQDAYQTRMEAAGYVFIMFFEVHMREAHDIDIRTNQRWLRCLGTAA